MSSHDTDYLNLAALAALLLCSEQTIRNNRSRAPWRVPPDSTPPTGGKLIWRRAVVEAWMAANTRPLSKPPRRPGRPPKGSQS